MKKFLNFSYIFKILCIISLFILIYLFNIEQNIEIVFKSNYITSVIIIKVLLVISLFLNILFFFNESFVLRILLFSNIIWAGLIRILIRKNEVVDTYLFKIVKIRNYQEKLTKAKELNLASNNRFSTEILEEIINSSKNYEDIIIEMIKLGANNLNSIEYSFNLFYFYFVIILVFFFLIKTIYNYIINSKLKKKELEELIELQKLEERNIVEELEKLNSKLNSKFNSK